MCYNSKQDSNEGVLKTMIILNCSNISKSYGIDTILEGISFNIQEKDRVGLVGVNGAGKSTLFKIITGEISADSGEVYKLKDLKIGYMAQNCIMDSEKNLWDELLQVFDALIEMENKIKRLEAEIEKTKDVQYLDRLVQEHGNLCEKFREENGYGYTSYIRAILIGLGFREEQFSLPIRNLSGGQKTRVALAKLLLQNPQLLLLDEPTNHLDIQAVEWLEDFLAGYNGSIVVISHDRYFLDKVTNRTIEIENKKAHCYEGNYSFYIKHKEIMREQQWKQYNLQQKEIARLEGIIQQQKRWNREKNIKAAESKQKAINRIQKVDMPENLPETIQFKFQTRINSGNDIVSIEELSKSFGDKQLFNNLNFKIRKGEKIFLLGANGTGKTTLFKILLGKVKKDKGKIRWGTNVVVGYYDQEQSDIHLSNTVIDEVWDANPQLTQTEIRNALAAFLFKGDDVFKSISTLSGGEKARTALVKLMLSKANFLILDEPTNHLDIYSREALEKALLDYEGTLLVVSHDRYFVNKISSKILELCPDGICEYIGNYTEYIEKKKREHLNRSANHDVEQLDASVTISSAKEEYQKQKEQKANQRKLQKMIHDIEEEIHTSETEVQKFEEELCSPEVYSDHQKAQEITNQIAELKGKIEQLYSEWEKLHDLVE